MPAISAVFALLPFQIPSSSYYAFPYIIGLVVFSIVVLALLVKFPSFRKYRRKRNIIFYLAVILVVTLLVFQMEDVTKRALVDFSMGSQSDKFYPGQTNQIDVSCGNHGDRGISFYIVLTCTNASFPVQSQQSYIQVDSKTVKVPFVLQENWFPESADSKPVLFTIDEHVTGFSFHIVSLDAQGSQFNSMSGVTELTYVWNATVNCYVPYGMSGFVV